MLRLTQVQIQTKRIKFVLNYKIFNISLSNKTYIYILYMYTLLDMFLR